MNAIQDLSNAIAHAMYKGFGEYEYETVDFAAMADWTMEQRKNNPRPVIKAKRSHTDLDIEVHAMFSQTWSSTALGFGGLGGQAMTDAYTIVLRSSLLGEYCVYFGGRFAYTIKRPNQKFFEDTANGRLAPVREKSQYSEDEE